MWEKKRKPANEDDDKLENDNPKAKRRRKGFKQDIRLFTVPSYDSSISSSNNMENYRVNQPLNIKTNEIDCRNLTQQARGTTVQPDNVSEYRVLRVNTAVQS